MGWQDREYNAGRENMKAYMANPLGALQYALPIFKSTTLTIRLSFWFLIAALFQVINDVRGGAFFLIPVDLLLMLGVVLWHELGHRILSRWVGGNHWEWVVWPLGGMVAPTAPHTPWPTFVANIGGIVFSLVLLLASVGILLLSRSADIFVGSTGILPIAILTVLPNHVTVQAMLFYCAGSVISLNIYIILFNFFPCYWFDGGHIWQSILWPKLGQWKSMRVVCLAGMILAVPLFALSVFETNIFGMLLWAMVFADCFRRRQMLAAAGEGVMDEDDGSSYNYMDASTPARVKKRKKRWFKSARRKASQDQAEQAKIDAILAKVKDKGLHSLTWWEKRTLRKATERQRQQDLAERY